MLYVLCVLIGVIAGLRAMTPLAAVSWAALGGTIQLSDGYLSWLAYPLTPFLLSFVAFIELITDKLPSTPSRKVPVQFIGRILSGALAGLALSYDSGIAVVGALAGAAGAVLGTLGGAAVRAKLAAWFGLDRPAAILEDMIAIAGSIAIVLAVPYVSA